MTTFDIFFCIGMVSFMYLIQIGVYWYVTSFPPKEINSLYGYRTPRSKKNQANWDFANALSNRLLLLLSHGYLIIALLLLAFTFHVLSRSWYIGISTTLYVLMITIVLLLTEYKLKQFEKTQV